MDLKAIKPVYRGGKLIQPGEPIATTAEDAANLISAGEARDASAKKLPAKSARGAAQAEKVE